MKHLFFLGIAGHAMGGLALAAKNGGYVVTGLDEAGSPPMSTWLDDHGLAWAKIYASNQLDGVDAVVISGQHGSEDHPVIKVARERNIRILSFAELLGEITHGVHVVAVAGTHGKSTTASLITWLLEAAGRSPDFLIGIRPFNFEASSRLNGAKVAVIEADEYKASTMDPRPKFDYYHPDVLVLTSIEHDHPDIYPTLDSYLTAFEGLVSAMPQTGCLVLCAEDPLAVRVAAKAGSKVVRYGINQGDYTAKKIVFLPGGIQFEVQSPQGNLGAITVPVYGRHNVLNSLAAVVVGLQEGLAFKDIVVGAQKFKGVFRRFSILTPEHSKITIIDDYAHHPTEARTTIEAAKLHFPGRRLVVVYRPHTYSRTQTLLKEYHAAFLEADKLYITDVEPARELANQRTVSGQEIVEGLPPDLKARSAFVVQRDELVAQIVADAKAGDVVLCMTVSGYEGIAEELAASLRE
ncbi:MAG TPA: Mur ligase family protein [Candidatus Saccharimonadales bacterium]|nr:Mur ligase family protein [Candidatus Saccharimonadales bacterium]